MPLRRLLAAAALLALFPLGAAAQAPMPLAGYRVSSWIETDGLPPGAIWALAQDADGYLWIGGDSGLARFDGERFRTWNELGGAPLPDGPVRSLAVGADGSLWAAFGSLARIGRIQGHEVTTFGNADGLADATVAAVAADRTGGVWAATSKGLLQFTGSSWRPVAGAARNGNMVAVTVSASGTVLAASDSAVFARPADDTTFREVGGTSELQSIAVDRRGGMWVTDKTTGLRSIGRPAVDVSYLPRGRGYRLLSDSRDNLWVAMLGQGVWLVPLAGAAGEPHPYAITDDQGLSNNVPSALLEDRNGNIWIGTAAGLNRLTPQRVAKIGQLGAVTGLAVTAGDTVWANGGDGLTRLTLHDGTWQQDTSSILRPAVEAMHADRHGALWIATSEGVERLLRSGMRVERQRVASTLRHVRTITSAGQGPIWIFDDEQGLQRWEDGRLTAVPLPPTLQRAHIYFMVADRAGRLWFSLGDQKVAAMLPGGLIRVYGASDGLTVGFCRQIFEDRQGTMWITGTLGLGRLKGDHFESLRRNDRRLLDLTGMIEDERGVLWLGAASGILHLTPAQFDRALADVDSGISTVIGATDGVAGTASWGGQGSTARTSDGRLWFLTAAGIITLDPLAFKSGRARPALQIDVVSIDDRRVPPATATAIAPSASRIQIEFSVANLRPEQPTRFRYRLDGYDTEWINSGRVRTAIYTNLPPRTYRFQVQVQDVAGTWRAEAATWAFTVNPAFYQTAWFGLLGMALVLALGWAAWHFRGVQMQQRLAILHGERARLSRELHDTLLQSLVGVSLQCGALAGATESATARSGLLALRRQVENYVGECRQSLWDLRSPMLETHDLPTSLRTVAERALNTAAMTLDMQVVGVPLRCPERIDQQLLRIGQEAVTNAVRHSGGRRVCVRLEYGAGAVTLAVTDDGHGFDPDDAGHQARGHWGLVGMQERAASAGGTLALTSSPTGTSVVITCRFSGNECSHGTEIDTRALHGRSSDRPGRARPDHQPAA